MFIPSNTKEEGGYEHIMSHCPLCPNAQQLRQASGYPSAIRRDGTRDSPHSRTVGGTQSPTWHSALQKPTAIRALFSTAGSVVLVVSFWKLQRNDAQNRFLEPLKRISTVQTAHPKHFTFSFILVIIYFLLNCRVIVC
jgi:hypothetical protein